MKRIVFIFMFLVAAARPSFADPLPSDDPTRPSGYPLSRIQESDERNAELTQDRESGRIESFFIGGGALVIPFQDGTSMEIAVDQDEAPVTIRYEDTTIQIVLARPSVKTSLREGAAEDLDVRFYAPKEGRSSGKSITIEIDSPTLDKLRQSIGKSAQREPGGVDFDALKRALDRFDSSIDKTSEGMNAEILAAGSVPGEGTSERARSVVTGEDPSSDTETSVREAGSAEARLVLGAVKRGAGSMKSSLERILFELESGVYKERRQDEIRFVILLPVMVQETG